MKDIIQKLLREQYSKGNMKDGTTLKGSQWLFDFIRNEEGDPKHKGEPVLKSYKKGNDPWTIGYGHTTGDIDPDVKPNMVITKEQSIQIMYSDLTYSANCIRRILTEWKEASIDVPITQNMFNALTSLVYNTGCRSVRKSKFIQSLKQGNYKKTAEQIKSFNLESGYSGLINRRNKESTHFLS